MVQHVRGALAAAALQFWYREGGPRSTCTPKYAHALALLFSSCDESERVAPIHLDLMCSLTLEIELRAANARFVPTPFEF
ncbi:protein of unknown function (plasmid) [Cupriavidus taiwanensis]|uniref:Uncharacterized protein n=1 Tax=Cupriavidus taiwanensis TaxID=164546 RepID=A0A375EDU5_9BURK|nr:protein of unknown function [Cupriavidus taiwanensis]SOZ72118.1 protein of unknown function [Cupriavidus taiwanensis]SOZ74412.1 protein of unknown function [Cupriavidus taiwanensis]SPA03318.1 protein of unknown function [Cupriavidus taiwanensis]SPA11292.1 protein of unknown function [Cupriavidus taiwanensis]